MTYFGGTNSKDYTANKLWTRNILTNASTWNWNRTCLERNYNILLSKLICQFLFFYGFLITAVQSQTE